MLDQDVDQLSQTSPLGLQTDGVARRQQRGTESKFESVCTLRTRTRVGPACVALQSIGTHQTSILPGDARVRSSTAKSPLHRSATERGQAREHPLLQLKQAGGYGSPHEQEGILQYARYRSKVCVECS